MIKGLRRAVLTSWMYRSVKQHMPKMSKTEEEALSVGDTWWEAEIFRGRPNWNHLAKLPLSQLSAEEQAFLDHEVTTLCQMIDDWKVVHEDKDLSPDVWQYIKDKGFFGMVIAKEYGGKGFSAFAHSQVVMKIASKSLTAAVTVMVPNSLGPGELLQHYGTEEQKQQFLPALAKGQHIPCFALTGPEAGSDAANIPDTGVVCRGMHEGQEVLGMRLNLNKRYITLAPVATLVGLAFKLSDPDHLLGSETDIGITVCLLPSSHPGLEIGERHYPLNQAFMNGPIRGKDVFVPLDWIIGGASMAGRGWLMLVECLSIGRAISLPAVSTAYAALGFCVTGAYAKIREQFKTPIGQFEGVEEALAQIGGFTYMLEACRLLTLTAVDHKIKPATASAIAKYHMTELGRKILNHAMDIHGGRGIILGPRNYLGRAYQGMPVCITVEGANILTRNLIIFGQGAMGCHPFIRREMQAAHITDKKAGLLAFDAAVSGHMAYFIKNVLRNAWFRMDLGSSAKVPSRKLECYYRDISRLSARYAVCADLALMILGGALKRKERLSARLGDVMSYLYMGSAVLKYFETHGEQEAERPIAEWAVKYCLWAAGQALEQTEANFPASSRWLVKLLVRIGRNRYQLPSDKHDHSVAQSMLKDSPLRQRLAKQCYLPLDGADPVGRVEVTFQAVLAAEPVMLKIKQLQREAKLKGSKLELMEHALALNAITQAEAELVRHAERLRADAIQVDAFTKDYIKRS